MVKMAHKLLITEDERRKLVGQYFKDALETVTAEVIGDWFWNDISKVMEKRGFKCDDEMISDSEYDNQARVEAVAINKMINKTIEELLRKFELTPKRFRREKQRRK